MLLIKLLWYMPVSVLNKLSFIVIFLKDIYHVQVFLLNVVIGSFCGVFVCLVKRRRLIG